MRTTSIPLCTAGCPRGARLKCFPDVTLYVLSDLHLDENGPARLFYDDRQGRTLAGLCARLARDEGAELVLLGDTFDFTAMLPPPQGLERFFETLRVPRTAPARRKLPEL